MLAEVEYSKSIHFSPRQVSIGKVSHPSALGQSVRSNRHPRVNISFIYLHKIWYSGLTLNMEAFSGYAVAESSPCKGHAGLLTAYPHNALLHGNKSPLASPLAFLLIGVSLVFDAAINKASIGCVYLWAVHCVQASCVIFTSDYWPSAQVHCAKLGISEPPQ